MFIGAENMFSLVEAVVKTSITLPRAFNFNKGLSRAGTSTFLTDKPEYHSRCRRFFCTRRNTPTCAFAVVVLVAHWFLRLDLEELLQQNPSFTPSVQPVAPRQTAQANGRGHSFMTALQGLLRGRATKNISLLLLLATTGTLYFVTYPANRHTPSIPTSIPLAQQRKKDLLSGAGNPAWHTWLHHTPSTTSPRAPGIFLLRVVRTTARMTRIVVLPIAATVAALYALLLYLHKDAERLEAQRHRTEADSLPLQSADASRLLRTSSCSFDRHRTIAVSADGRTAAGVGLGNELILWANGSVAPIALGAADVLSAGPSNLSAAIIALALDDPGSLCAAAGAAPRIVSCDRGPLGEYPCLRGSFSPTRPDPAFETYENGTIFKWDGATPDSLVLISPPQGHHVLWSSLLRIPDTNRLVAACSIEDGSPDVIELMSGLGPSLAADCRLQAGNPTDTVARFHACLVALDGMGTLVIAAATEAGVISLWDGTTSCCIALLEEPHGALSALRLCPASCKPCMACGAPQPDSFALVRRSYCSVFPSISPPRRHFFSRLFVSTLHPSRSRHASMSEDNTSFPISGHGVLSRRASEKDSLRRTAASDTLAVPERKLDGPLGPPSAPHIPARWRSFVVGRVVDTMCERGAWDVTGSRVVGLRRRSRRRRDSDESKAADAVPRTQRDCGLSAASLERWEAWSFDPAEGRISASPLAALQPIASGFSARSAVAREMPRPPFTRWAARERADVLSCWVREHGWPVSACKYGKGRRLMYDC
ncbi:hypothetical protein EDB89DRAFT_2241808 [Lactarius sanguifluus]|nr:hypothetical protein EDB89DRAFT_2241808 [Lactarius sanguifluus]